MIHLFSLPRSAGDVTPEGVTERAPPCRPSYPLIRFAVAQHLPPRGKALSVPSFFAKNIRRSLGGYIYIFEYVNLL